MGSHSLAFKTWLKDENVYLVSPLESFRGRTIGIDAEDYFHSILSPGNQAPEPLLPAHGGNGFTIKKRVDEDLDRFKEAGIKPWFVFNGMDLICKDRASVLNDSRKAAATLDAAWRIYDSGDGEQAVQNFGRACTYRTYHVLRSLMFHLHRQGVMVQIAPYTAAAHLAYLEDSGNISGVMGSASCFLYGVKHVLLEFEWAKNQVAWAKDTKVHEKLQLNKEQFSAACLISGSSILPALPELDRDDIKHKIVSAAAMLKSYEGNIDTLLFAKGNEYQHQWYRAHYALKHPLLFQQDGKLKPKDWANSPSDYNSFVGAQLPPELMTYLSRGLIGPRVINWRQKLEILETPPLDCGLSPSYQDLVANKLRPIRSQTLGLLTQWLHRYWQNNEVKLVCWYDAANPKELSTRERQDWGKYADTWHVLDGQRPKFDDNEVLGSGLVYAILALSKDADAKRTVTPRDWSTVPPLEGFEEVRSNIVWRFLHDRGYINDDHTLTSWGRVLKAAYDRAAADKTMEKQASKTEMEEIIFLAIELIRLDILGTQQMFQTPVYSGGLSRGTDKDKINAMLISRVACLGHVEHDKIGYTGPLSRSLLAYHQMTAAVRGALRDLMEVHAGYTFLSGSVKRTWQPKQWTTLADSLPFVEEPDLGLGLVVKSYLDELSSSQPADVKGWFHHVHDLDANLRKAWSMWDAINAGIQAADGSIVNSDTKMTFKTADTWLKTKLEQAPEMPSAPNGTA